MQSYTISNQKRLMQELLLGEGFDAFFLLEMTIHKQVDFIIDGRSGDGTQHPFGTYRRLCYEFTRGDETPGFMKYVLLSPETTEGAASRSLTIMYRDGVMTATSGFAQESFSFDREPERQWDEEVARLLNKFEVI